MLEHQAPIILHYNTLMAKKHKCVEVSRVRCRAGSQISTESLCSVQEFCKAEKQKGDDERFFRPLNPHVQHGRACILCQPRGSASSSMPCIFPSSSFPRVHCSSSARVCVHPGAGVLVTNQYAIETRRRYLHHHSVCLSRCSPYGLTTQNILLNPYFR